jgi:hypothetical protein
MNGMFNREGQIFVGNIVKVRGKWFNYLTE